MTEYLQRTPSRINLRVLLHLPITSLGGVLGFKFAFVRNPWSWVASHYATQRHLSKARGWKIPPQYETFDIFIPHFIENAKSQSWYIVDGAGVVMVDFLGQYENLQKDFATLCKLIGLTGKMPPLGVHHSESAKQLWGHQNRAPFFFNNEDYRLMYNTHTQDLIYRAYAEDIRRFGYHF